MAESVDARLASLGITLPEAAAPAANYVPTVRSGSMLYISGQVPIIDGKFTHVGQLGDAFETDEGAACARICAINIIAQAKQALGDLGRVKRIVKLVGFVNSTSSFTEQPKVINGASDLMVEVFGEAGKHARSAVGVAQLPFGVAVEVEAILEVA